MCDLWLLLFLVPSLTLILIILPERQKLIKRQEEEFKKKTANQEFFSEISPFIYNSNKHKKK